jgi:hypothetical protein
MLGYLVVRDLVRLASVGFRRGEMIGASRLYQKPPT